jgi:hypothetical protein
LAKKANSANTTQKVVTGIGKSSCFEGRVAGLQFASQMKSWNRLEDGVQGVGGGGVSHGSWSISDDLELTI